MSAGRKRLDEALEASKNMENNGDEKCVKRSIDAPRVSSIKDVDFGDIMGVYSVHLSQHSQYMAAGCGNGAVQVYACDTGKKRRPLKHGSSYALPITAVKFFPFKDNRLVSAASDGTITCWDLEGWCHLKSVDEFHNEISTLDFSHDGKIFATAGKDKMIRVYDSDNMQLKLTFGGTDVIESNSKTCLVAPGEGAHGRKVFGLRFHPFDDNVFLTGGWDRCLKIWDVRVDQVVRSIHGPYICGDGIDVFQDEILTASWVHHNALQIWDYGSGQLIENIPFPSGEHGDYLYVGRFVSSHVVVAGGTGTNDVKILTREPSQVIATLTNEDKPVQALDISPGAQLLALGGTGSHIQLVTLA